MHAPIDNPSFRIVAALILAAAAPGCGSCAAAVCASDGDCGNGAHCLGTTCVVDPGQADEGEGAEGEGAEGEGAEGEGAEGEGAEGEGQGLRLVESAFATTGARVVGGSLRLRDEGFGRLARTCDAQQRCVTGGFAP